MSRRALILSRNGLLAAGIRALLARSRAATVIGIEPDVAQGLRALRASQPDVLIVDVSGVPEHDTEFRESGVPLVVTVSLEHPTVTLYWQGESRSVPKVSPAAFIRAIRDGHSSAGAREGLRHNGEAGSRGRKERSGKGAALRPAGRKGGE